VAVLLLLLLLVGGFELFEEGEDVWVEGVAWDWGLVWFGGGDGESVEMEWWRMDGWMSYPLLSGSDGLDLG
jgi:hypothetical protein